MLPNLILVFSFFSLFVCLHSTARVTADVLQSRLDVVFYGSDWADQSLVIRCSGSKDGQLLWAVVPRRNLVDDFYGSTTWNTIVLPSAVKCQSNPVSLLQPDNSTYIFFQTTSGQVYFSYVSAAFKFGNWKQVAGNLKYDEGAVAKGRDSVTVKDYQGQFYVFARSFANASHFYWSAIDKGQLESSPWALIGGNTKLGTDAVVAYNSFTKLLEAFMVSTDGYLYRSWQLSKAKWSSWDKTGWSAPKTNHAPVVHSMDTNMFNGRLNVFIHGTDGKLHHIWQTTCDKVPNPWGWCTWSTWYQIGNTIPSVHPQVTNSLSIGNNIHLGIEVFVADTTGRLYKLWQDKRHGSWSDWKLVQGTKGYKVSSLPAIVNDGTGWWSAYALDASMNVLIVQQNRSFTLSPSTVVSGSILTASWNMPVDEASSKDWIGILPNGGSNHFYVDYVYVGGSQNPRSEVLPNGNVSFTTYLPKGQYNVRYLVDKRYVAAVGTTLTVTSGPSDEKWVQVINGIFHGLNIRGVDIKKCVNETKEIPKAFLDAFTHFEDRDIYTGLSMLGIAVGDIMKAVKDCGIEKTFINRIMVLAKDMEACFSQKDCTHFIIDLGERILVLYENIYEIYGDVIGAANSFKIQAFTQGGVNVGRVIAACISLPRETITVVVPSVIQP